MPKSLQTWLIGAVSAVYLVLSVIVWKRQGYDVGLEAFHLSVTAILWVLLGRTIHSYWKDSKQAGSLRSQIVTIKEEAATQIAHLQKQAGQQKQRAEQSAIEKSQFESRAVVAEQELTGCKYLTEKQITRIHELEKKLRDAYAAAEAKPDSSANPTKS